MSFQKLSDKIKGAWKENRSLKSAHYLHEPSREPETQGYLVDITGIGYSRDIGRSFTFGPHVYYIFGDTFCKNAAGDFVGVISNSVAMVKDKTKPLQSTYLSVDPKGLVEPFLKLSAEEEHFEREQKDSRVVLWSFSGVLDTVAELGHGLVWYEKSIVSPGDGPMPNCDYVGLGLATVTQDKHTGHLTTTRQQGLLFEKGKTRYGSFSVYADGDYAYLYGLQPGETEMALARVRKDSVQNAAAYEHFTGTGFSPLSEGSAASIWSDNTQGAVFPTTMFGPEHPYAAIAVNKWADSKIRLGLSPALTGPWEWHEVGVARGINVEKGFTYCMYPHPWALAGHTGTLFVTWSEQWPGSVIGGKIHFKSADSNKAAWGVRAE